MEARELWPTFFQLHFQNDRDAVECEQCSICQNKQQVEARPGAEGVGWGGTVSMANEKVSNQASLYKLGLGLIKSQ